MSLDSKIQKRLEAAAGSLHRPVEFDPDNPDLRFVSSRDDKSRRRYLLPWTVFLIKELANPVIDKTTVISTVPERSIMLTSEAPKVIIDVAGKLSVFALLDEPQVQGSVMGSRLVLSEADTPSDELATIPPLLQIYGRSNGTFAAESPLLFDAAHPGGWIEETDVMISVIRSNLDRT